MPRYAPRDAFRTRFSSVEHPDASGLATTGLERAVVRVELREPPPPPPVQAPPVQAPVGPRPAARLRSPLRWAPGLLVGALALGVLVGAALGCLT